MSAESRHRDTLVQIHILNGVEQFHTLGHRALEGLASHNETLPAGALVDHRCLRGIREIVIALGAAAVDQANAPRVAVHHLVAAQVNRMVAGQLAVNALVKFAV